MDVFIDDGDKPAEMIIDTGPFKDAGERDLSSAHIWNRGGCGVRSLPPRILNIGKQLSAFVELRSLYKPLFSL
jgi:hypothetical protein